MKLIGPAAARGWISRLLAHAWAPLLSLFIAPTAFALAISSVSPNTGPVGTVVTINGSGFGSTPAANTVTFNGTVAVVSSASTTKLVTKVPTGATSGPLKVKVGTSSFTYNSFTVGAPLSITSVSPSSGPVGTAVTIAGTGFSGTAANNVVTFNGVAATVASASSTQLMTNVPSGATSGPLKVVVGNWAFTWNSFTVTGGGTSLVIASVSPASGPMGTTVTISGAGFSATAANNVVTFNGTAATVSSASSNQLVVTVPSGATSGPLKVAVGNSSVTWNNFTVGNPLTISSVSPTSGPVGARVTISGTGFSTTTANDAVTFNGTAATVSSASTTQLVVTVPSGATSGPLKVVVGSSSFTWNSFTVGDPLTISSVAPTNGPVGTAVTISGTGFSTTAANNAVTFNGTAATVTSATSNQLVVSVPTGASSGALRVKVADSTFTYNSFTVTPAITGFSPTDGPAGTPVTITGTNFDPVAANDHVDFNGVAAVVTAASATQLTATAPAAISTGPIHVKVGAYTATSSSNFSAPSPTIESINPNGGPPGAQITIKGSNFSTSASSDVVTFGGVAASVLMATPTQLLAVVPDAARTGPVQVTIAGQIATSATDFTVTTPNVVLTPTAQSQQFTLPGRHGQPMVIEVTNVVLSSGSIQINVFDPNNVLIANGSLNSWYQRSGLMLFVDPFLDGTYVVQATLANAPGTTASVQILFDDGMPLAVGAPIETSTYLRGQSARFNFNATAGQSLTLMMTDPNSAMPAYSYVVYKPDGTKYTTSADSSCSGGAVFSCDFPDLPQTGTYTLVLMPSSLWMLDATSSLPADRTFAAKLKLATEPTGTLSTANATVTLAEPGQHARLRFDADAGQLVTIGATAMQVAANDEMSIQVEDGNGIPIARTANSNLGGAALSFVPRYTGSHTAFVYATNGATGSAQLRLEPGTPLAFGVTASVRTTLSGALSRFNFNATAGQNIALVVSGLDASPTGNYLSAVLFNPDGTLSTRNSYNGLVCDPSLTATGGCGWFLQGLPQTGNYSLLVFPGMLYSSSAAFPTMPGTFNANVTVSNDPDGAAPLPTPAITGLNPSEGPVGSTVLISGQHFGANPIDNRVMFSGKTGMLQAVVISASSTQLAVTVPDTAATGPLSVNVGGGSLVWSPVDFTVKATLKANVTLTLQTPEPSLVGTQLWLKASVTPADPGGVQPTGTVTIRGGLDSCEITLGAGADYGCGFRPQQRGSFMISARYSGDSHYVASNAASIEHNVFGLSLYGISAAITNEPSQAGYGAFVGPLFNTGFWNYPSPEVVIYDSHRPPNGLAVVSDGVSSCTVQLGTFGSCFLSTLSAGTRPITVTYLGDDLWEPATAQPIWHSTSSAGGADALPPQTEICGFDPKANYPAASGFVPIEQLSSAVPSMGLVPGITGDKPLTVSVTNPAANSTTPDGLIDVVGTFTGPANTGITVNGIIATTLNGQFVVNNVPLTAGANTLNVVATTLTGAMATATASVTRGWTPGPISISVGSGAGAFAPASVSYNYSLAPLPNGATVSAIRMEYGTIADPWNGTDITSAPTNVNYSAPGLYALKLRVTDNKKNIYIAQRTVIIRDYVAMRSMLCDVYGYLKDRLKAQDASGAANAYQPLIRTNYQSLFQALGSGMPAAAPKFGFISSGFLGTGYAEITLARDNADQTRSGFPLRMTQGSDGVWRISEM